MARRDAKNRRLEQPRLQREQGGFRGQQQGHWVGQPAGNVELQNLGSAVGDVGGGNRQERFTEFGVQRQGRGFVIWKGRF